MYINKVGTLNKSGLDIMDTIEGTDIFNSKFIFDLDKYSGNLYKITSCEGRLDLIIDYSIGKNQNYGINYVLNRITDNSSLSLGRYVELMTENDISAIKNML